MDMSLREKLVVAGEQLSHSLRYSEQEMAQFAALTLDRNPLHFSPDIAGRAGFGGLIASGQQTSAIMMGLLATHFSRRDDGIAREMLCLNVNFAFKTPLLAGQDIDIVWTVASADWHSKLDGMLTQLDGHATPRGGAKPAVVGRATILVKFEP
ncbi:MaoC family dehydratase [Ideonella sp. BN130291]|uniref:MaoC family dehydratase n=1 Tax=Ideonella sp. BN130291 TaxID=3112940 RepID=UPI002E275C31|nr:MaoC family dehydratase [Ideonella sp. BN130291]